MKGAPAAAAKIESKATTGKASFIFIFMQRRQMDGTGNESPKRMIKGTVDALGKNLPYDVTMDVGQATFQPIMIKAQALVIQAHQVKNGRIEVVNG